MPTKKKKHVKKQESLAVPASFDYTVDVIPQKSAGGNALQFQVNGNPTKSLTVKPSNPTGDRLATAWTVDTSQVPGETATLIYIDFSKGTPFSYIIGGQEIDDSSGTGINLIWKRVKRKGHVQTGVNFYYSVSVTTTNSAGITNTYIALENDPMVIVN